MVFPLRCRRREQGTRVALPKSTVLKKSCAVCDEGNAKCGMTVLLCHRTFLMRLLGFILFCLIPNIRGKDAGDVQHLAILDIDGKQTACLEGTGCYEDVKSTRFPDVIRGSTFARKTKDHRSTAECSWKRFQIRSIDRGRTYSSWMNSIVWPLRLPHYELPYFRQKQILGRAFLQHLKNK